MSIDWSENYLTPDDEGYDEIFGDRDAEIIDRFATGRLRSYFDDNPNVADPARRSLGDARALLTTHAPAAHVLASAATEVILKAAVLRPLMHGLIHEESLAAAAADLTLSHSGWDRYRRLLFALLAEYAGIDLDTYSRPGMGDTLWSEIQSMWRVRNEIVHKAGSATRAQAEQCIGVATALLDVVYPALRDGLDLDS